MMKYIFLSMLFLTNIHANFNFGECQGSGTFEQQIEHYQGDYENAITVGTIPVGIEGLRIELVSSKDVDIRLYAANNDRIVHWPYGIHNQKDLKTKPYQDVNVTYSGYNGIDAQKGHEFIEIIGATPTVMTMKAFGYRAGYATVNYSWTGKEGCDTEASGQGSFTQILEQNATSLVGTIPPNVHNVQINLTSDKDLDIQLYGANGTAIVSWKPTGLLFNASKQSIIYNDMNITWSGYNGTNGNLGNEYITITPKTTEILVMKVYGYEAGEAEVTYSWGSVLPVEIAMSKASYDENESLVVNILNQGEDNETWVGVYHVDDNNDWANVVKWDWTHGNDSVLLDGLDAGEYEARLFYNNSFTTEASVPFTVTSPDKPYADLGQSVPIFYDNQKQGDQQYVAYYPEDGVSADMPVVMFIKGGGTAIERYSGIMKFMASKGYFVIGVAANSYESWYVTQKLEIALNEMKALHGLNVPKLVIMGHSLGGGQTFYAMKKFRDDGYGAQGSLALSIDGWFSFNMDEEDLNQLDSNVSFIQMNGILGAGTDPRIHLKIWDLATQADKTFYTLPANDHGYVAGDLDNILTKNDLRLMIGALTDDVFNGSNDGKDAIPNSNKASYLDIYNALGDKDSYNAGDCAGIQYNAINVIENNDINYCDVLANEDMGTKQLILDSGYLWIDSYPTRFIEKSAYLHTLPFSGFTMNSNAGDNTMEPNYSLVYDNVWNEVQGDTLKELYQEKSNFLKIRIDFPGDFWDQSAWDKVTHNFVIMARVAKNLHYAGIIFDNEPYSDRAEKLVNYKHGDDWFDVNAYRNPNHNFSEHVEKITQLFKGIMEAMVVEYPDIEVLFYHTPVNSHKKADTGINNHPVVVHVGLQRQHELWGPIFIGFKKGLSQNAKLHDMGEDYRLRTQEHFDDVYEWRKHTIATDATNIIDSSMYWTVPVEERASWEHDVNVNFMASNDPLHSDTYPEFDTTDKVSLEDIRTTLERSLEKADKYVVFYSRNTNDDPLDFMKDKASVDAAWYQMFEDIYAMPNIEK